MKKVVTVVGARPQFIKSAPVSKHFAESKAIEEIVIHTGQHYDSNMSDIFFEELKLSSPRYNLGISSSTHGAQTGRMLEGIEQVLIHERPDCVLVYGDTNSTLAGSLAATKMHIPVAHVEAGLRSFNKAMPEEINRVLTDHVSSILFAPTNNAVNNLLKENIPESKIILVGDVMLDAHLLFKQYSENSSIHEKLGVMRKGYVLATIHRAENTDDPKRLKWIFNELSNFSESIPVIFPVHPRTQKAIQKEKLNLKKIVTTEPLGFIEMIAMETGAKLIATDSGGIQKEAFFHGVPCITFRDETEWVELVELGANILFPPLKDTPESLNDIANKHINSFSGTPKPQIYGTGNAAIVITQKIIDFLT